MQIILLDKVVNLGDLGEVVKVKNGYALLGSVTNHDISADLTKQGFPVAKSQIRMSCGPLKTIGDYALSATCTLTCRAHQCGSFELK